MLPRRSVLTALAALTLVRCAAPPAPPQREPGWVHLYGVGHPLTGRVFEVRTGRFLNEEDLLVRLQDTDFVLLGESHDNLDHQRLEARIIRALGGTGHLEAVAFEMIDLDQQTLVVERLQDQEVAPEGFGKDLAWQERGWGSFDAYRPIIDAALAERAQIVGANLPSARVASLMSTGYATLPEAFLQRTGLAKPLSPRQEASLRDELAAAHCGRLADPSVEDLAMVQRARDATMADRLVAVAGRGQAVLVAGAEHVRIDWGVPWYLAEARPNAMTVAVAFLEVDLLSKAPPPHLPYDYVWFTPATRPAGADRCGPGEHQVETIDADARPARPDVAPFSSGDPTANIAA